jgi:hypothetical protein
MHAFLVQHHNGCLIKHASGSSIVLATFWQQFGLFIVTQWPACVAFGPHSHAVRVLGVLRVAGAEPAC